MKCYFWDFYVKVNGELIYQRRFTDYNKMKQFSAEHSSEFKKSDNEYESGYTTHILRENRV